MSEPLVLHVDAESVREEERRHLDKAAHYRSLADKEMQLAARFAYYAEQIEAGHSVTLSHKDSR